MPSQNEIRENITQTIIQTLEKGGLPPWRQPWSNDPACGFPTNVISKKAYRGINPLLLQIASMRHGFTSKWWATYKQWSELGGQVKRRPKDVEPGEWGTKIVFWKRVSKNRTDDEAEENDDTYPLLRTFTVFNIEQVEGDRLDHLRVGHNQGEVETKIDAYIEAQRVVEATDADIRNGGNRAYYSLKHDFIQLPHQSQMGLDDYYCTLFHELSHWACAAHRLGWKGSYAEGELIAEIGSCFLAGEVGIPTSDDLDQPAAYMAGWLKSMKEDPKFIFRASSTASKAADLVLSFSRSPQPEEVLAE